MSVSDVLLPLSLTLMRAPLREAVSAGGSDLRNNLATACNKCNGRKSAASLDKWGARPMDKPIKGKYGEPQEWEGLSSLFVTLAERDPAALTAGERDWLRALRSSGRP